MPLESRLALSLSLAVAIVYLITPVAIRVAGWMEFYDRPAGYKGHGQPTPYLGGAAVMAGFLTVLLVMTSDWERTMPVVGGAVVLWIVGTVDDRRTVAWWLRVAVELALAGLLWSLDLGWALGLGPTVDLTLTCLWVIAVVNSLNLFDNMDGQASTMAAVISAAVAVLGLVDGQVWLVAAGGALAGACVGFLPHNLATPSRIFLGDGGSMPVGFALAAIVMIGAGDATAEWQALAVGLMLVGVPALDTTLVIISRRRRGISVLTGGRDHLTHRTRERVRTARAVAMALGGGQALLAALALFAYRGGSGMLLGAVLVYLVVAGTVISLIDEAPARAEPVVTDDAAKPRAPVTLPFGVPWEALVLVPLGAGMALSPFAEGYYESAVWAPVGLGLVVVLVAALIARPPRLGGPAMLTLAGLAAYGTWALVSTSWADSAQQAIVEGNRWLVYAVLLGVLVTLVRTTRTALWLLGAVGAGSCAIVAFEVVRFAAGGGETAFLGGRLNEPLAYINALGTFHILALFCAVGLAERRSRPWMAGLGMGMASLAVLLLLLSQSRGVAISAAAAALVVLVAIPGRVRRAYGLLTLVVTVALLAGRASDLYDSGLDGRIDGALLQETARLGLVVAVASGVGWGILAAGINRLEKTRPVDLLRVRKAGVAVLAVLMATTAVAGLASFGRLTDKVDEQYTAFVKLSPEAGGEATGSRLVTGAGNRYDYWRIAKDAFSAEPLAGVGAGNYDARYFRERTTAEDIRQPHSLVLQTLSELGLLGGVLLLAMLAGVGWGLMRMRRVGRELDRVLTVAAAGTFTAWLVHTNVDWIHLVPGVTAMALAAAAVLLRPGPTTTTDAPVPAPVRRPGPRPRLLVVPLIAVALMLTGVSLSRQVLSEHYARQADDALAARPAEALKRANQALRLQPELVPALYTRAAALARFGDAVSAKRTLEDARRREPDDFVTWALLGDLSARTGDLRVARRMYREALRRNPRDPGLQLLVRDPRAALPPSG